MSKSLQAGTAGKDGACLLSPGLQGHFKRPEAMTLISEQFFKPYSPCHLATAKPSRVTPGACACHSPATRPFLAEGPDGVRRRLGCLLDKDMAQLESGKSIAKLLKRGKLIARWARAVKDITTPACREQTKPVLADAAQAVPLQTVTRQAPRQATRQAPPPWERTTSVPMGVEAFRTAVAKELSLIRDKKENIP